MPSGENDSLALLKHKYDDLLNEGRFEINTLSEELDFENLTYHYKG